MVIKSLHLQVQEMRQSFFDEGYLNSQYTQLEALAKDTNPNFIIEIITLYFRDSPNGARSNRGTHDYQMHSSVRKQQRQASYNIFVICIGASKVFKELQKANTSLKASNTEGIKVALGDIKKEHSKLRAKFETYFQLMRQAGPTDVAVNSS
ncbi:predicted protein [Arabidopsis lyrata subsp. lyrata]|uniref:Histidine-containing phosphotransfer protein n=1 Tax=Arabidopsis lyrata subsp. lyrata TaxID=81972 RepID=D7LZA9_ARALL|nr:predicted protein [Arabidopsis lyrata subsp. lyrata]